MGKTPIQPSAHNLHVEQIVAGVAARLSDALRRCLDHAIPPPRRMTDLRDRLTLDKTLASRLSRAADATDALEALSLGPGAPGYRILIDRLRPHPAGASAHLDFLAAAVDDLERAYAFFPNGRRGFDAALSAWVPDSRLRGERRARQQIYQAMLFLMGVEIDVAYQAYVYWPSAEHAGMCDLGFLEVRQDLRRTSLGGRVIITGVPYIIPGQGGLIGPERVENLRGEQPRDDARIALLPDFCTQPLPDLQTHARAGALQLVASGDIPSVGQRLTTSVGVIGRNIERQRRRAAEREYSQNSVALRKPVRVLVIDVLVCDSLELAEPRVTVSAVGQGPAPRSPDDDDLAGLNQSLDFTSLHSVDHTDLRALASPDVARVPEMMTRLLGASNAPLNRLRAFRLRVEYPIPHARHVVWLELPPPAIA